MKSPYQRLIESCGVTQIQFRERFGFSKPTFVQVITGQYANLSDRMVFALGELCHEKGINAAQILDAEYGCLTLQDAYHQWQSAERQAIAGKYLVPVTSGWTRKVSPFDVYVSITAGSRARFCKELKVDAARVRGYASGQSQQMPYVIQTALKQIQYPWFAHLIAQQENWRLDNA